MKITDEMVRTAFNAYWDNPSPDGFARMRAALEAALGVSKLNDGIVSSLRVRADLRDGHMGYETLTGITCRDAAACIEDFAEALKPLACSISGLTYQSDDTIFKFGPNEFDRRGEITLGQVRRARAVLERWGMK